MPTGQLIFSQMTEEHPSIWAWRQETGDSVSKLVLLFYANAAGKNRCSWPSIKTCCKATHYSYSAVWKALKKLEGLGLIVRETRQRDDGSLTSSVIHLTFKELQPLMSKKRPVRDTIGLVLPNRGTFHGEMGSVPVYRS